MKYFMNRLLVCVWVLLLTACGGGEGSPKFNIAGIGSPNLSGSTTTTTQTSTAQAAPTMTMEVRSGAGIATTSISVLEIAQVVVILKNAAGLPMAGEIVTFAETGSTSLLSFAPAAKTALTGPLGEATVEVRAASPTSAGATTITAAATTTSGIVVPPKEIKIQVTSSPVSVIAVDPQALANALNFLDVNPADKSIVLQGSGGNGRSESATLRFRVVDKSNTPVKGAKVTFEVVPSTAVTLNITQATSDADGVVVTTVSSLKVATSVVIKATVTRTDNSTISSQSDQLLVTTGLATQAGFDMSAKKFNLNAGLSGDFTSITVAIVDKNGNPVADGVPVVFTANFGAVGSSSRGGCVTSNGSCSVPYVVQNPRPADGQLALVTASTQLGDGTSIGKTLPFRFSSVGLLNLFTAKTGGILVQTFDATVCGKQLFTAFAGTPGGFPAPAGTTVKVTPIAPGLSTVLKSPGTIEDQLSALPSRTSVDIEVDISGLTRNCDLTKSTVVQAEFDIEFKADTLSITRRIAVNYLTAP